MGHCSQTNSLYPCPVGKNGQKLWSPWNDNDTFQFNGKIAVGDSTRPTFGWDMVTAVVGLDNVEIWMDGVTSWHCSPYSFIGFQVTLLYSLNVLLVKEERRLGRFLSVSLGWL